MLFSEKRIEIIVATVDVLYPEPQFASVDITAAVIAAYDNAYPVKQ
ncbi:MAG: hypothetical protein NTY38_12270 [Acidobacteria bacterium]|nr:hypothetical protein [Acidobacteriota bacterium]